jgi:hypothetical protein
MQCHVSELSAAKAEWAKRYSKPLQAQGTNLQAV